MWRLGDIQNQQIGTSQNASGGACGKYEECGENLPTSIKKEGGWEEDVPRYAD